MKDKNENFVEGEGLVVFRIFFSRSVLPFSNTSYAMELN